MPRRHEHEEPAQRPAHQPAPQAAEPGVSNALIARMSDDDRRVALAARGAGNHQLSRALRLVQREDDPPGATATASPPGRGVSVPFGEYWVVPDTTTESLADVTGEQITETDFAALQAAWDKINDGSGQVKITEADDRGGAHAGFKATVIGCFGTLMSMPRGRALVVGLVNGAQEVTIGPTSSRRVAVATRGPGSLENADGSAGTGGGTTIRFDADLTDTSVVAFDATGAELAAPVWSILGHELIHAEHNAAGRNRRGLTPRTSSAYGNREEEETIATGSGVTENTLRSEHGMPARFGHGARDTR